MLTFVCFVFFLNSNLLHVAYACDVYCIYNQSETKSKNKKKLKIKTKYNANIMQSLHVTCISLKYNYAVIILQTPNLIEMQ